MSRAAYQKVYRRKVNVNPLLDVHSIASLLRGIITYNPIVLTWHQTRADMTMLEQFLKEAGYDDILPPTDNCIPMIPQSRRNMPKRLVHGGFPLKLEIVFPLSFPYHKLVERDHQALIDAIQLRLLAMDFEARRG